MHLSTQAEAKQIAADAMGWIENLRNCTNVNQFNRVYDETIAKANSRHVCAQIMKHFAFIADEERRRLGQHETKAEPVRGKSFAQGPDA